MAESAATPAVVPNQGKRSRSDPQCRAAYMAIFPRVQQSGRELVDSRYRAAGATARCASHFTHEPRIAAEFKIGRARSGLLDHAGIYSRYGKDARNRQPDAQVQRPSV